MTPWSFAPLLNYLMVCVSNMRVLGIWVCLLFFSFVYDCNKVNFLPRRLIRDLNAPFTSCWTVVSAGCWRTCLETRHWTVPGRETQPRSSRWLNKRKDNWQPIVRMEHRRGDSVFFMFRLTSPLVFIQVFYHCYLIGRCIYRYKLLLPILGSCTLY